MILAPQTADSIWSLHISCQVSSLYNLHISIQMYIFRNLRVSIQMSIFYNLHMSTHMSPSSIHTYPLGALDSVCYVSYLSDFVDMS
jgi:hypothetical protein